MLAISAILVSIISASYLIFVFTPQSYIRAEGSRLSSFPPLKPGDRITVIAPHPDDEALGLGGLITQARQQGIPVSIVFMTNGDANYYGASIEYRKPSPDSGDYRRYGEARQGEALAAAASMGVEGADVYFLGLPDRGLKAILSEPDPDQPFFSKYTESSISPYPLSFLPGLPYSKNAIKAALVQAMNRTAPTLIFAPLAQEKHTDHSATGRFVQEAFRGFASTPHPYSYLVHYPKYPLPRGVNPNYPLLPPQKLSGLDWKSIDLSTGVAESKRVSLLSYKTQLKIPEAGMFLKIFARRNELVVDGF